MEVLFDGAFPFGNPSVWCRLENVVEVLRSPKNCINDGVWRCRKFRNGVCFTRFEGPPVCFRILFMPFLIVIFEHVIAQKTWFWIFFFEPVGIKEMRKTGRGWWSESALVRCAARQIDHSNQYHCMRGKCSPHRPLEERILLSWWTKTE